MKSLFPLQKPKKIEKRQAATIKEFKQLRKDGWKLGRKKKLILWRKKPTWKLFEDEVYLFFSESLKLDDVEQRKRFGKSEVDVSGGIDDIFLVVDCKTKEEPGRRNLHDYITNLSGKRGTIRNAIRGRFGRKYRKIVFVLALRDIDFGIEDESYAKESGVFLWSEKYFDILKDIYSMLGPESKYYFLREMNLGDMKIKSDGKGRYYVLPALRLREERFTIYNFFMEADKLLKLAYVARLETGVPDAYQRLISRSRLSKVSEFIGNGGSFKNNIILGAERKPRTSRPFRVPGGSSGGVEIVNLKLPKNYLSLWVIDGQHRLYGFSHCNQELRKKRLPVTIIQDVNKNEQAQTFVDINHEQKPVDSSLLWQLFGTLRPNTDEGAISEIVKQLCVVRGSSFRGKIFVPGISRRSRKNYSLFFSNVCKGILDRKLLDKKTSFSLGRFLKSGEYTQEELGHIRHVIDKFFKVLIGIAKKSRKRRWIDEFILTNNGLNVFLRVLYHCLEHFSGKVQSNKLSKLLTKPLRKYFIENFPKIDELRKMTSSEGTREYVSSSVIEVINKFEPSFAQTYLAKKDKSITEHETYKVLVSMETKLKLFIEKALSRVSTNWWKQRLPEDVRTRAEENWARKHSPFIYEKPRKVIDCLDFMDYPKIITRADNWRDVFHVVFQDEEIVRGRFKEMRSIRVKIAHPADLSDDEKTEFISWCRKIENAISVKRLREVKKAAA